MIRLATVNGKYVPLKIVASMEEDLPPTNTQEYVDMICAISMKHRPYYFTGISDFEPFDPKRAKRIMDILLNKGLNDPKAFAWGQMLKKNGMEFIKLAR